MPLRQKIFFLTIAVGLLVVILELVRRRRLRVEYSWLWIASGATIILLILRYDLLIWMTELVGAVVTTSTLFFFCILFLALLCLNYSVRLSTLTREVKELAQELALLRADGGPGGRGAGFVSGPGGPPALGRDPEGDAPERKEQGPGGRESPEKPSDDAPTPVRYNTGLGSTPVSDRR
jgi:hypothetical protein